MDDTLSPYLQNSSNTIILLKLKIDEHDGKISYVYDHWIPDTSLGAEFYWDASNFLRVRDVSGTVVRPTELVEAKDDKRWNYIQRHGFVNNLETSINYDETLKVFTINVVDTSWNYMQDGSVYNVEDSKSISVPDEFNTPGPYYIFIDNSLGDLSITQTPLDLIDSKVHVASIVWDDTLVPSFQLSDERHQALIDKRIHYHLHQTLGTAYISGGDVSGYMVETSTNVIDPNNVAPISLNFDSSASWNRIFISETVIVDEDLIITLPALEKPDGINLDYTLFSRTDVSKWKWELIDYPYPYVTDGYIVWDEQGVLREPSANYFVNSYLLYTNIDGSSRYVIVPGQGQYETLKDAVTETPIKFNWNGFPLEEYIVGWQFTWETSANFPTMPGYCALAWEPKRINVNPRTDLYHSFKVYHNATGGLQGGNDPDEYYHVTKLEKKAVAILTPLVPDIIRVVTNTQWIITDASFCVQDGGYNTGMRSTTWKEQKQVPPSTEWVDTGNTEERLTQNTTACPITPYRAAFYVGQSYDTNTAHNFTFSFGVSKTIETYSVPNKNFLFISIPTGHDFKITDGGGVDIRGQFGTSAIGTDNVIGYRNNSVWQKVPMYASKYLANFNLTIL